MSIEKFITVTEVDEGPAFADGLFQRAYKKPAPDFPHHIVAFYRRADGSQVPVSYVHFTDCGDMFLAGGAATDGNILRSMSAEEQAALNEYGGLMLATLRHGFMCSLPPCAIRSSIVSHCSTNTKRAGSVVLSCKSYRMHPFSLRVIPMTVLAAAISSARVSGLMVSVATT
jgi:hypothetical protein